MFVKTKAARRPLWAFAGPLWLLAHAAAGAQQAIPAPNPTSTAGAAALIGATPRPDPANPMAAVPPAVYLSPLRAYQGFVAPPLAPWRDSNEQVHQRGGWRAYAREGQAHGQVQGQPQGQAASRPDTTPAAAAPAAPPAPTASQPAPGHHAGHPTK